jgi:hypothetical protein
MKRTRALNRRGPDADLDRYLQKLARREVEILEEVKRSANQDAPRVVDFFPELKNRLNPPFANSLDPSLKIPTLLPFYQTLIVGVSPFRDIHTFEENYGLSLPSMIEQAEKGRLVFILNGYPEDYKGLSYLSPLLYEFAPPTIVRFRRGFDQAVARGQAKEFARNAEALFKGRISNIPLATQYLMGTVSSIDKVERGAIGGFIELQAVGAQGAVNHVRSIAERHPTEAAGLINTVYRPLFADSVYGSLSGQHALLRRPEYIRYCKELPRSPMFFIDEEIGRALISGLQVRAPTGVEIFKDVDVEYAEFRKALCALERAVTSLESNDVVDHSGAIKRVWQKIDQITKKEKRFQKLIQTVGVVGAFAVKHAHVPGLVNDVFPALMALFSIHVSEPLAHV